MSTISSTILDTNPPALQPTTTPTTPQNLFPTGCLTLLLGEPGIAKSLISLDLAARLSRGYPLNTLTNPPPNSTSSTNSSNCSNFSNFSPIPPYSLICSREDSPDFITQRLQAAGADTSLTRILRFTSLTACQTAKIPASPGRPAHDLLCSELLATILNTIKTRNLRLIILDPLSAFLDNFDASNPAPVRRILQPLIMTCHQAGITLIGIAHLAKSSRAKNPLDRILGSSAYTALARSVLLVTRDDLTWQPHRRLLIPLKNNTSPITHALAFNIRTANPTDSSGPTADPTTPTGSTGPTADPPTPPGTTGPSACLDWESTPIPDHPLLPTTQPACESRHFEQTQLERATDYIRTTLANGPIPCRQLFKQGTAIGLAKRTIERARLALKARHHYDPTRKMWLTTL